MYRFYLPSADCAGDQLQLGAGDAHHARHVLRIRPGEEVTVLDGEGHEYRCVVAGASRTEFTLRKVESHQHPPLAGRVTVYQAVTKARSMDWVMPKATELGAWQIVPVLTARSVPHFGGDEAARKVGRWRELAIEAIKQCGSPWLPRIEQPVKLVDLLLQLPATELAFVGSLRPPARHPREYLGRFRADHQRDPRTVAVWIGPEGDFTPGELEGLESVGILPVSLGPLVLRAETATIYFLAFLSYELRTGQGGVP